MKGFKFSFSSISLASFVTFLLLVCIYIQSEGIEGGMDSWQHYLISKHAVKYPGLLLDQWNKPVFTWLTLAVCQFGMHALVLFNILCTLTAGILTAYSVRNYPFAWILVPLTVFCPVLLGNTVSGLTEPLNALILAVVLALYAEGHGKSSAAVACFFAFVRTEGFVICGAILIFLLFRREYRMIPWLFAGSLVMNTTGAVITGEPFWMLTSNPYLKFELEGTFDPGKGSLLHYVHLARPVFGLPLLLLFLVYHLYRGYMLIQAGKLSRPESPAWLIFWSYFAAHTLIYFWGILGSHGLTRVMAVVAPPFALMAFHGLHYLASGLQKVSGKRLEILLFMGLTIAVVWAGYGENDYAKPYRWKRPTVKPDKSLIPFEEAGRWLENKHLMNRTLVHQSPYFNVRFGKDPYNPQSSYYIWSIDQNDDWSAVGTIVIWDGFSAVREGNMKLKWLAENPAYREIHRIPGKERPEDNPEMYDVVIFEKIR